MPRLRRGSTGIRVGDLERRLLALGYYLPRANRRFDFKTSDALMAFSKVQGGPRTTTVTRATWRRLVSPRVPRPRVRSRGRHIEIDQTRQVLLVVVGSRVRWILHTSTGAGRATRDGSFRVRSKLAGYSANRLYYPSYFDGLRAIHGWPDVPPSPASHGCARVPMWAATWIYRIATVGTRVIIYH